MFQRPRLPRNSRVPHKYWELFRWLALWCLIGVVVTYFARLAWGLFT